MAIFSLFILQDLMFVMFWLHFSENNWDNEELSLSDIIKQSWLKRKQLLDYDFAVTSWALSILPEK